MYIPCIRITSDDIVKPRPLNGAAISTIDQTLQPS